ncbi:MAG: hypothetical protein UT41_C0003G0095 [Candidatus Wolfebacteria bacterium GW2011_GWC2_39_22]|uniref:Uncharacterized protein n=1 Tax=Candidatus Wolfebacteria bacterium GW2011_GWC2_39_22 TaxID=1619013 RepID=A0A0G0N9Q2_9BACT|nr:MAG: hypothetical protein UT41_C0003G0095 [Candidatus Wolfebacteria bacterium GW2011_GWC2_39_22]HBI25212.1 hypothetical protein [Candidatus Wolfebacteria bacterium]
MQKQTRISSFIISVSSLAFAFLGGIFIATPSVQAAEPLPFINTTIAKEAATDVLTEDQRKAILREIVSSSQTEIKNIVDALTALKLDDAWSLAQADFLAKLATSSEYYDTLSEQLENEDLSLEDIKTIAKDLKEWREAVYAPELKEIGNLILVFQTKTIYDVVQLRSIKISSDLKKLDKQNLVNTDTLKKYLTQADKSIKNAKTLTDKATDLYYTTSIEPLQPKQAKEENTSDKQPTSLPVVESTENDTTVSPEIVIDPQDHVRALAKESLKELKTAYELFFKMNDRIRK